MNNALHSCIADTIDLCTPEGSVKELFLHGNENAASFFKLREICLVVKVEGIYVYVHMYWY